MKDKTKKMLIRAMALTLAGITVLSLVVTVFIH